MSPLNSEPTGTLQENFDGLELMNCVHDWIVGFHGVLERGEGGEEHSRAVRASTQAAYKTLDSRTRLEPHRARFAAAAKRVIGILSELELFAAREGAGDDEIRETRAEIAGAIQEGGTVEQLEERLAGLRNRRVSRPSDAAEVEGLVSKWRGYPANQLLAASRHGETLAGAALEAYREHMQVATDEIAEKFYRVPAANPRAATLHSAARIIELLHPLHVAALDISTDLASFYGRLREPMRRIGIDFKESKTLDELETRIYAVVDHFKTEWERVFDERPLPGSEVGAARAALDRWRRPLDESTAKALLAAPADGWKLAYLRSLADAFGAVLPPAPNAAAHVAVAWRILMRVVDRQRILANMASTKEGLEAAIAEFAEAIDGALGSSQTLQRLEGAVLLLATGATVTLPPDLAPAEAAWKDWPADDAPAEAGPEPAQVEKVARAVAYFRRTRDGIIENMEPYAVYEEPGRPFELTMLPHRTIDRPVLIVTRNYGLAARKARELFVDNSKEFAAADPKAHAAALAVLADLVRLHEAAADPAHVAELEDEDPEPIGDLLGKAIDLADAQASVRDFVDAKIRGWKN
jgi:hypothetical protein